MVKKQKDKQYNSAREQRDFSQWRSTTAATNGGSSSILPFHICSLSLIPYQNPVCTKEGILFENNAIVQYLLDHDNMDPVTGRANMTSNDLIVLHMDREDSDKDNGQPQWKCPIVNKRFQDHMKIVAIIIDNASNNNQQKEAYVYSYEAYYELNVKPKHYHDLTTGKPFHKNTDVIILNDPTDMELNQRRDMNNFHSIKHARKQLHTTTTSNEPTTANTNIRHSLTASRIMETIQQKQKQNDTIKKLQLEERQKLEQQNDDDNDTSEQNKNNHNRNKKRLRGVDSSSNDSKVMSSILLNYRCTSERLDTILAKDVLGHDIVRKQQHEQRNCNPFTSTAAALPSNQRHDVDRIATDEDLLSCQLNRMRSLKKKGYVKMNISISSDNDTVVIEPITIELHCDIVPRTCINFLGLCMKQQYDTTIFHRLISNFMIQGGSRRSDGTKKSNDDASLWGANTPAPDELDTKNLKHVGCGVVAMANSGPNTSKCQFYITFDTCQHLDGKHTIFGHVVNDTNGVVKKLQNIPTNKSTNMPLSEIKIISTEILVNPAVDACNIEFQRLYDLTSNRQPEQQMKNTKSTSSNNDNDIIGTSTNETVVEVKKSSSIGKYLKERLKQQQQQPDPTATTINNVLSSNNVSTTTAAAVGKVVTNRGGSNPNNNKKATYGNFSNW